MHMFAEKEYELKTFCRDIKETADSENDDDCDEKNQHFMDTQSQKHAAAEDERYASEMATFQIKSAELESENQQQKMIQSKPILLLFCFEFIVETVCLNERHAW